jgi:hypothetical protein
MTVGKCKNVHCWGELIGGLHPCIHKVHVILPHNLQSESHKLYDAPISVTWLQLLRKQTNTGISTAQTAETH